MNKMYNTEEVLNNVDKTFGYLSATSASANKVTCIIPAITGKRHFVGSIILTGTAGSGGAPTLTIKDGSTTIWSEAFTIGTDTVRQFQAVPLVGTEGKAVTIEASATNLTAGKIFVVYYTR